MHMQVKALMIHLLPTVVPVGPSPRVGALKAGEYVCYVAAEQEGL